MPAKKKKSIQYKIAYYDENGKRRGKTFSAPTMREARLKAAQWEMDHPDTRKPSMTVLQAVDAYIETKAAVLSPATVVGYKSVKKASIEHDDIGSKSLAALTQGNIQTWINSMAENGISAKTISNRYGLLPFAGQHI